MHWIWTIFMTVKVCQSRLLILFAFNVPCRTSSTVSSSSTTSSSTSSTSTSSTSSTSTTVDQMETGQNWVVLSCLSEFCWNILKHVQQESMGRTCTTRCFSFFFRTSEVEIPGSMEFSLDGGDASEVEAASEATLVPRYKWGSFGIVSDGCFHTLGRRVVFACQSCEKNLTLWKMSFFADTFRHTSGRLLQRNFVQRSRPGSRAFSEDMCACEQQHACWVIFMFFIRFPHHCSSFPDHFHNVKHEWNLLVYYKLIKILFKI